jgi:hypothetical protein
MPQRRRHLPLLLAIAGLAAGPAPAASQNGPAFDNGTLFGGGRVAGTVDNARVQFMAARSSNDGGHVRIQAHFLPRCSGVDSPLFAFVTAVLPVGGDRTFQGSGEYQSGPDDGDYTIGGRYVNDDVVAGTARLTMTTTFEGRALSCDTGLFSWQARDPLHRPGSGRFARGARYLGATNQAFPAMIRTARRGRRVALGALEYELGCDQREKVFSSVNIGPIDVTRRGRFSGAAPYSEAGPDGSTLRVSLELSGRFAARALRGTLSATARMVRDGEVIDRCRLNGMRWAAERARPGV